VEGGMLGIISNPLDHNQFQMVMEYLEGGTLTEAHKGHEFAENEIAFVAREVFHL
jgi:hypothetical protein